MKALHSATCKPFKGGKKNGVLASIDVFVVLFVTLQYVVGSKMDEGLSMLNVTI